MNSNSGQKFFQSEKESVVIFGGTFDPIHIGHLIIAEQSREQFDINNIIFVPAGDPPHKERFDLSPAEIRYKMTAAATSDNKKFKVSSVELDRDGPSYTAKTIREYADQGKSVSLIIGADSLAEIFLWKDPDYILETARLLVAQRPGYNIEAIKNNPKYLKYEPEIIKIDTGFLEISSSIIRKRVKESRSIRYLVTPEVRNIILTEELYQVNAE